MEVTNRCHFIIKSSEGYRRESLSEYSTPNSYLLSMAVLARVILRGTQGG